MTASGKRRVHDEVEELLGAYALDAVDPDEAARVEAHLAECPRCAAEVAHHHEVAGLLANTGGDAPVQLWDRIADRLGPPGSANWEKLAVRLGHPEGAGAAIAGIDTLRPTTSRGDPGLDRAAVQTHRRGTYIRVMRWAGTAVAAAAAVLALVFGIQAAHLNDQVARLQSAASQPGLAHAAELALEDPAAAHVTLRPAGSASPNGPSAVVAVTPTGAAYLVPRRLAPLPADRTYQLWGKLGGQLVSFGLLGTHPTTAAFTVNPGTPVTSFAITVEPAGGSVQPTRTPTIEGSATT